MVPTVEITALGYKIVVELKRSLKDIWDKSSKKEDTITPMKDLIYKFFTAVDKSRSNVNYYKNKFDSMSNTQFISYFKGFFEDENAYLTISVVDYEHNLTMEDIEAGAKVINVPLFEYVYLPHITMDKSRVIVTKHPVPVGYILIKRPSQTIQKKNGISTNISQRSAMTNQITGKDKNGRSSDIENTMLISMGLTNTMKELNSARSDDSVMKEDMLRDIAMNGYTSLEDMTDDVSNKTTLNTVDTFFISMGIKTDLVTKGLMTNKTLKEEL